MSFKFEKLSVLVVEDTEPMQKLISSVLEALGVGRVFTASDGKKGFEMVRTQNPDILLIDWHMEPANGTSLIKMVRNSKNSPNKTVPIIMMTGYSAAQRVSEARDLGATEFLVKPFSAHDLAKRIAYVINKPRDFVEANKYFGPDRRRKANENYTGSLKRSKDKMQNIDQIEFI